MNHLNPVLSSEKKETFSVESLIKKFEKFTTASRSGVLKTLSSEQLELVEEHCKHALDESKSKKKFTINPRKRKRSIEKKSQTMQEILSTVKEVEKQKFEDAFENFFQKNHKFLKESAILKEFALSQGCVRDLFKWIDDKNKDTIIDEFKKTTKELIKKEILPLSVLLEDDFEALYCILQLLNGKTIKTAISEEKELEKLRQSLIDQIPNIALKLTHVGNPGYFFCNNNYILSLQQHKELLYDPNKNLLTIKGHNDQKAFQPKIAIKNDQFIIGEPIMCDDGFHATWNKNIAIYALNDGNGWGQNSRNAAVQANRIGIDTVKTEIDELLLKNTMTHRNIIKAHDKALFAAQNYLIKHLNDKDEATRTGTTCPLLLTIAQDVLHISVIGDIKVFIVSKDLKTVREPTAGNRGGFDIRDPGGRIGGYRGKNPDLRNYTHSISRLEPADIVIICTDGVHDNLDPKVLGISPQEADAELTEKEWDEKKLQHSRARYTFMRTKLQQILTDYTKKNAVEFLSEKHVNTALFDYIQNVTLKLKLKMLKTTDREPMNKKKYPGKLDHAGMLVYLHPS